jgi:hypothetical protein
LIDQKQVNDIKLPAETSQQLQVLQARITSADIANIDLRRELVEVLKSLLNEISTLQKENRALKEKLGETQQ